MKQRQHNKHASYGGSSMTFRADGRGFQHPRCGYRGCVGPGRPLPTKCPKCGQRMLPEYGEGRMS